MNLSYSRSAAQLPGSSLSRRALLRRATVGGAVALVGAATGFAYLTDDPVGAANEALMRLRYARSAGSRAATSTRSKA